MKVFSINARTVMILTVVAVLLIVLSIVIIFGRKDNSERVTPEIEIVLPEGVTG